MRKLIKVDIMKKMTGSTSAFLKKIKEREKNVRVTAEEARVIIERNSKRPISLNLVQRYCRQERFGKGKALKKGLIWEIELDAVMSFERPVAKAPRLGKNAHLMQEYLLTALKKYNIAEVSNRLHCSAEIVNAIVRGDKVKNLRQYLNESLKLYQESIKK